MRVRAKEVGFCGHLREVGAEFILPAGVPIGRWMEPLDHEARCAEAKRDGKPMPKPPKKGEADEAAPVEGGENPEG